MRTLLQGLLVALPFVAPAGVQGQAIGIGGIGAGLVCDMAWQVERFVALRNGGDEILEALETVNHEAEDASACGVTLVIYSGGQIYSSGKPLNKLTMQGKPAAIVEITVHAFGDGQSWQHVQEMTQYTVVLGKGETI